MLLGVSQAMVSYIFLCILVFGLVFMPPNTVINMKSISDLLWDDTKMSKPQDIFLQYCSRLKRAITGISDREFEAVNSSAWAEPGDQGQSGKPILAELSPAVNANLHGLLQVMYVLCLTFELVLS